jgi:hypothetical protein
MSPDEGILSYVLCRLLTPEHAVHVIQNGLMQLLEELRESCLIACLCPANQIDITPRRIPHGHLHPSLTL